MSASRFGASSATPIVLASLLTLAACGGSGGSGWRGSVTDSSGVQVVVNPARGLWGGHSPWHFEETLHIGGGGSAATSPEAEFGKVQGLDLDSAGDVYVADVQAHHVQVFAPDGHFLRTIGAPGAGPGEIGQAMAGVLVHGDEVWVPDIGNQRIDRFGLDGKFLAGDPLDFTKGMPAQWAHLSGGHLVARLIPFPMPGMPESLRGNPLVMFGSEVKDTILFLPKGGGLHISGGRVSARLFEPQPVWTAAPDGRILTAMSGAYRIEVRDATGKLVRVMTKPFTAPKVTASDQSEILDALRKEEVKMGLPAQAVDQALSAITFASTYPAIERLLAGPDSTVWVQRVRTAKEIAKASGSVDLTDLGSDVWDVFDGRGRYLGAMTLPPRFSPMLVKDDAFWGVQRDSLDVPSVARCQLVRATEPTS